MKIITPVTVLSVDLLLLPPFVPPELVTLAEFDVDVCVLEFELNEIDMGGQALFPPGSALIFNALTGKNSAPGSHKKMASNPLKFGPILWPWIHLQSKRLDAMRLQDHLAISKGEAPRFTAKRAALRAWLDSLDAFVPCDVCEHNTQQFNQEDPLPDDRDGDDRPSRFWEWSVRAHNHANRVTGRRESTLEEAEAAFQKQWLDPTKDKQLDQYQLARTEDQQRLQTAEAELVQLRQQDLRTTTTNVTLVVVALVVLVLVLWTCGWVVWRGGHRAALQQMSTL